MFYDVEQPNIDYIPEVFDALADIAPRRFDGLLNYMRSTWFRSTVWPVKCWSVYGMSIRTNNDVDGKLCIHVFYYQVS